MALALILALSLAVTDVPPPTEAGEPLPPGAPQDEYLLAGWCYGALAEYLEIYDTVKPDLIDMDRMFGSSVKGETEPYSADVAASRDELKIIGGAITAAEKANAQPIAPQGALAIRAGQAIWQQAENRTRRELARAWMSWGLPDRCDVNARQLTAKANVLGRALSYNNTGPAPAATADTGAGALNLAPIAPVTQHFAGSPAPVRPVAMAAPAPAAPALTATQNRAADTTTAPPAPPPPGAETSAPPAARVLEDTPPPVSAGGVASAPQTTAPPQPRPVPPPPAPTVAAAPAAQPPQTDQSSEPVL